MYKLLNTNVSRRGFSLIELVAAVGVFIILIAGATYLSIGSYDAFSGKGNVRQQERMIAEAHGDVLVIKERSWSAFATYASDNPSAVRPSMDGSGNITFESGSTTVGVFERGVYVYNVQRNSGGTIVASGGTNDPSTKRVVILVKAAGKPDYSEEFYISNWESVRWDQTDWKGTSGTTNWTDGSDDYYSQTDMDTPTTAAQLSIATSTLGL